MNLPDLLGKAAKVVSFLGIFVFIAVGWAHGGKFWMSFLDPALKNKISPLGIKLMILGGSLLLLALVLEVMSIYFI